MKPNPARAVTVITPAFNAEQTIQCSVLSALQEPCVERVWVVDDASTDRTVAVLEAIPDPKQRLRIVHLERNQGPAYCRNRALALCESDWVCIVDADDYLEEGRIKRLLEFSSDECDLIADDIWLEWNQGTERCTRELLLGIKVPRLLDLRAFVEGNLSEPRRERREMGYLKPLIRREFLLKQGLSYDTSLRLGEDYILYGEALLHGARFLLSPACGYVSVQRDGSLSRRHGVDELELLLAADKRLLERAARQKSDAVHVLEQHASQLHQKLVYRRFLAAKSDRRYARALALGLSSPSIALHIAREALLARMGRPV